MRRINMDANVYTLEQVELCCMVIDLLHHIPSHANSAENKVTIHPTNVVKTTDECGRVSFILQDIKQSPLHFLPPEAIRNQVLKRPEVPLDSAVMIWSLAATLLQRMMNVEINVKGSSLQKLVEGTWDFESRVQDKFSKEDWTVWNNHPWLLKELIVRSLHCNPAKRVQPETMLRMAQYYDLHRTLETLRLHCLHDQFIIFDQTRSIITKSNIQSSDKLALPANTKDGNPEARKMNDGDQMEIVTVKRSYNRTQQQPTQTTPQNEHQLQTHDIAASTMLSSSCSSSSGTASSSNGVVRSPSLAAKMASLPSRKHQEINHQELVPNCLLGKRSHLQEEEAAVTAQTSSLPQKAKRCSLPRQWIPSQEEDATEDARDGRAPKLKTHPVTCIVNLENDLIAANRVKGNDRCIFLWNLNHPNTPPFIIPVHKQGSAVKCLSALNANTLAVGLNNGRMVIYSINHEHNTAAFTVSFIAHDKAIIDIQPIEDGQKARRFASVGADSFLRVWWEQDYTLQAAAIVHSNHATIRVINPLPSGELFLTGALDDGTWRVCGLNAEKEEIAIEDEIWVPGGVRSLVSLQDEGDIVVTNYTKNDLAVWMKRRAEGGGHLYDKPVRLADHTAPVLKIVTNYPQQRAKTFYSLSKNEVILWSWNANISASQLRVGLLRIHSSTDTNIHFSTMMTRPDGRGFLLGKSDGNIELLEF